MSYYQSIVDRIPSAIARSVDPIVVQSLLVGYIAKRNVLLRYSDDGALPGYLSSCSVILGQLFGLSVQEIELTQTEILNADEFLRLLSAQARSQSALNESADNTEKLKGKRRLSLENRPTTSKTQTGSSRDNYEATSSSLPQVLLIAGIENISRVVQRVFLNILLDGGFDSNGQTFKLPGDFIIVCLCKSDLYERPNFHKNLVDYFAISSIILDAGVSDDAVSNQTTSENDTASGTEYPILADIEVSALRELATPKYVYIANSLSVFMADLFTLTRNHPHFDGSLLGVRARSDALDVLRVWRVLFGPSSTDEDDLKDPSIPSQASMLDVSIDNVCSVFMRVVPHRLRVRHGPTDEVTASAIFNAADTHRRNVEWPEGRRPVTEILRHVLMDCTQSG